MTWLDTELGPEDLDGAVVELSAHPVTGVYTIVPRIPAPGRNPP